MKQRVTAFRRVLKRGKGTSGLGFLAFPLCTCLHMAAVASRLLPGRLARSFVVVVNGAFALVERLPDGIRHMMSFMMKIATKEGGAATYMGAPIRCEGHVMGSLCAVYGTAADPSDLANAQMRLERAADRLGALLETM